MPKKYHITPKAMAPRYIPVGKSGIIDFEEDCLKCTTCVKKRCLYDVYKNRSYDSRTMVDSIDFQCKNCFSCIQNCPRGVLSKTVNPEFLKMGDDYWRPDIILTTWFQAETGKIPVSGAGYRGPFSGPGFDSMWTDMSEIVRPTRDGIHGREYISTAIDIGKKVGRLEFDEAGTDLLHEIPTLIEIPLPLVFNVLPFGNLGKNVTLAIAEAAKRVGTMAYVTKADYDSSLEPYKSHLIPLLATSDADPSAGILENALMVELLYSEDALACVRCLKEAHPQMVVSVRVRMDSKAKEIAVGLAQAGVEAIHLCADYRGNEFDSDKPRFVKDVARDIHLQLVTESLRDAVTLLVSGGIALAEHLPKALICGADGVAIDLPLLISFECRVCKRCIQGGSCPVTIESMDSEFGAQRIVNLMSAWWSQLIEVMGAMGIRDARRVRGEAGRAMFFEDLERETFGAMFANK
ncbi:MAG: glutamate synthase-related protein [Syntrophobacteraceae bacterium]